MGHRVDDTYWFKVLQEHEGHQLYIHHYPSEPSYDIECADCGTSFFEAYKSEDDEDEDEDEDRDDEDDDDEDPEPETVCKQCGSDDLLENSLLCADCAKQNELGV